MEWDGSWSPFHSEALDSSSNMEWNGSLRTFQFGQQESYNSSFLYNYTSNQLFPEVEQQAEESEKDLVGGGMEEEEKKKKRLSKEQIQCLETSFEEGIKLDPDRKMKLSMQLGLQPKQIAVWFQNRRARWKNKHLHHLYFSLKQQFDTISQENHHLQQQVIKLRSMLGESGDQHVHGCGSGLQQ